MVDALPALRLGIEPHEHAALVALIPRLRDGSAKLKMSVAHDKGDGACIAEHVGAANEMSGPRCARVASSALRPLFSPGADPRGCDLNHPGWRATAAQGAEAIERFLGGAGWECWEFMRKPADA